MYMFVGSGSQSCVMCCSSLSLHALVLVQNAIARCAATQRKINEDVWQLFTDGSPSEVVIPNCTDVNEAAMLKGLKDACTYRC